MQPRAAAVKPPGRYLAGPAKNEVLGWEVRTPKL
jgi:hypothetical protein